MSKIREKESLECRRMHIWALKTQKLPGPLSGPWTPAANCSLRSNDSASLRRQLSASEPGAPPLTKSWIRTCIFPHFFQTLKNLIFLINHHCISLSETFDSVGFVGIVWCSCRVVLLRYHLFMPAHSARISDAFDIWKGFTNFAMVIHRKIYLES